MVFVLQVDFSMDGPFGADMVQVFQRMPGS